MGVVPVLYSLLNPAIGENLSRKVFVRISSSIYSEFQEELLKVKDEKQKTGLVSLWKRFRQNFGDLESDSLEGFEVTLKQICGDFDASTHAEVAQQ